MPVLPNAKQERFAQEVAKGKSATEAYLIAGYNGDDGNASRMLAKVNHRVMEITGKAAEAAMESVALTKEWVIKKLVQNVNRAMQVEAIKDSKGIETGEYRYDGSVANKALELLGKEIGMFIDRKEIRTGHLDELPADSIADLREQLIAERDRRVNSGSGPEASRKPH
jgi:phage terminase small subunit